MRFGKGLIFISFITIYSKEHVINNIEISFVKFLL